MFDSPFTYCKLCNEVVLLDQTRRECAQEHGCGGREADCPLRAYFTGIDFRPQADEKGEAACKSPASGASSGARPSTRR